MDLYEKDDIYKFEPLCFAFGEGTPGSCSALPDVETEDDMVDWVKRSGYIGGATSLARRQEEDQPMGVLATPRRYYLKCDTNKKYKPVTTEDYHSGPEIIAMNPAVAAMPSGVPALFPLITCDDIDDDDCLPNKWKVKELIKVSNIADHDDDVKANEEGNLREFGNRLNVGNWAGK